MLATSPHNVVPARVRHDLTASDQVAFIDDVVHGRAVGCNFDLDLIGATCHEIARRGVLEHVDGWCFARQLIRRVSHGSRDTRNGVVLVMMCCPAMLVRIMPLAWIDGVLLLGLVGRPGGARG